MAHLVLDCEKLRHNYKRLDNLFGKKRIAWSVVSKLLCGNETYLRELIALHPKQLCDARISNLKAIKKLCPQIETIYIKPPPPRAAAAVVQYADISFNTQYRTVELLSREAVRQRKTHRIIIAVELGERREGVMRAQLIDFYEKVQALPRIRVIGLGANFACLSGVLPSRMKLEQLTACRDAIAERFQVRLACISGGSSVTIPLLHNNEIPRQVNHFRVGETLFFGTDVYNGCPMEGMYQDVIMLYAQIVELIHKPLNPNGELGRNLEGNTPEFAPEDRHKTSWRAIVDVGLLDVESSRLTPTDPAISCLGASSDMLVINLGTNPRSYQTGDYIGFKTDYMGVLRLMNSRYIDKRTTHFGMITP